jgi:Glycine rich protein
LGKGPVKLSGRDAAIGTDSLTSADSSESVGSAIVATHRQGPSGSHRRGRRIAALSSLCALAWALAWAVAPAWATTKTFTYTGAEQMFVVPGGVHTLGVVAIGGGGGAATSTSGGEAAQVTGNVSVTPGQTLYIEVGGKGQSEAEGGAGGFNGGASGAGGGGGASDIRTLPESSGLATDTRLVVAAGGGGGGDNGPAGTGGNGGAAGSPGGNGEIYPGGGAGTATEGGEGGFGCEFAGGGGDGQLGAGGNGGDSNIESGPGGGGGGGYYGGGGGGGACISGSGGGGGGSSLVPSLGLAALSSAAPQVEITYTLVPPTIEIASPANGAAYTQGEARNASYSCTPPEGTSVETCEGPVANGAALDTSTLGPHAFTVEAEDADGAMATEEVTYTVVAPPSISIATPADGGTYTQGQAVTAIYSCTPAGGTGVKACAGPVANGAALDTSTLGSHAFTVKAEDTDGGKSQQSVNYTVVAPPKPPTPPAIPDTTLGSHPKKKIETEQKKVKVKFSFSSTVAGATFECKLDGGRFASCTSPKSYKVKPGKHTFSVEAVSTAGTDPSPATFSFKVKKKH